jgi:hypothetical protein
MLDLASELKQFTGTEQYYRYHQMLLTDGVKYFCDTAQAYWLLDIIHSVWDLLVVEDFVAVTLTVKDRKADFVATDGGKGTKPKVIYQQHIAFTDCPEGEWHIWLSNGVAMLKSEY